jgi:hypothetical protein
MKNPDQENFGQDAIIQFILRPSVFIAPGSAGDTPTDIGSGTVIRTRQNHLIILTAKHVAEDAQRRHYRIGYGLDVCPINNFVAGILLHPDEVDVALLIIKEALSTPLKEIALKPDVISNQEDEIRDDDCLILNGFPAELSRYSKTENVYGLVSITYWGCKLCPERYDGRGRYQVEWKDAEQFRANEPLDLPPPDGTSGGPLCRFRKSPKSQVWSPEGIGNIVGIQSEWDRKETLLVEPVQRWGDWFQDSIDQVDGNYSSLIN